MGSRLYFLCKCALLGEPVWYILERAELKVIRLTLAHRRLNMTLAKSLNLYLSDSSSVKWKPENIVSFVHFTRFLRLKQNTWLSVRQYTSALIAIFCYTAEIRGLLCGHYAVVSVYAMSYWVAHPHFWNPKDSCTLGEITLWERHCGCIWVGQRVCSGFSVTSYGKTGAKFLANQYSVFSVSYRSNSSTLPFAYDSMVWLEEENS